MPVSATAMIDFAVLSFRADENLAAGRRVLDGVVEQILQHVAQQGRRRRARAEDRRAIRRSSAICFWLALSSAVSMQASTSSATSTGKSCTSSLPASMRASFSRSSVRRASRVAWSRIIRRNRRLFLGSSIAPGEQRFGKALNGGERRLEFVRDVGHEILAHAFEPPKFGHVMQHHHRARGFFGSFRQRALH